jgi:polyphenol oxidase
VDRPSVIELAQPDRAEELHRLRQAVQLMKDLTPATNPLRFDNQVNLHCNHCGVATGEIHYNWQFLPWHRAMLFFHERILNKLVPATGRQPPIRVPYWPWDDWSTVANRSTPAIYGASNQPLNAVRNPSGPLAQGQVDVQPALGVKAWQDFIGTANSASLNFSGPHANVHNWARAILSSLRFSPLDPLFYAHHTNIDRLWSSWFALGGGRTNPDFGDQKAYFFDEDGQWRSILLNDVKTETTLGYKYSSLMHLQKTPVPSPFNVTMLSNQISDVADAASPVKRTAATTLLLRGVKLGSLVNESNFGVFVDTGGAIGSVSSPNFLGRFSTVEPVHAEPPGGLTVALSAAPLQKFLADKPKLVIRALDNAGKAKGPGIPLATSSVSLL